MKLQRIVLCLALLIGSACVVDVCAMGSMDSGQVEQIEFEISKHLKDASSSFAGHLNQIKSDLAAVIALELIYAIGQQSKAVDADSRWIYAVRAWEVWTAFSSLQNIGMMYDDLGQFMLFSNLRKELHNQLLGLQHGQDILEDVSGLDSDFTA